MGKTKQIELHHELMKFITNLYKNEVQLNFCDYFEIVNIDNKKYIKFPNMKYYHMTGEIDLSSCPSLDNFITSNKKVRFDNTKLDAFRKLRIKDLKELNVTDNKYIVVTEQDNLELVLEDSTDNDIDTLLNMNYDFILELNSSIFEKLLFTIYLTKDNIITYEYSDDYETLFDSTTKNFNIKFKCDAQYKLYATKKNENGFRIVELVGIGPSCTLRQYFRVI